MPVLHVRIPPDEAGQRLDRWLKTRFPGFGWPRLQKMLRRGEIRVDGKRARPDTRLPAGADVRLPPALAAWQEQREKGAPAVLLPEEQRFFDSLVLYEDDWLMVLNKPAGLPVQGGSGTARHLDMYLAALAARHGARPRLAHRLDRDTSGVLVVAKSRRVAADLGRLFASRAVSKTYWALTHGAPRPRQGVIDAPLVKVRTREGEHMAVPDHLPPGAKIIDKPQNAKTRYNVLRATADERIAWLSLKPVTGRTHQLRVHLAHIGHPIVGDPRYGGLKNLPAGIEKKLHLHARRLIFPHPVTEQCMDITAPLPPHMQKALRALNLGEAT